MAEALFGASDLLVVGVPTFGWAEGRYFLVKSGSGAEIARYLDARPEDSEDVMLVLRYFDAMNRLFHREPSLRAVRDHGVPREPHRSARGKTMGGIRGSLARPRARGGGAASVHHAEIEESADDAD